MSSAAPAPALPSTGSADTSSPPPLRLVLCDDHAIVRTALADVLSRTAPRLSVVADTGDPRELSRLLRDHEADLVLLDLNTGPPGVTGGLQVIRALTLMHPRVGVVVLSASVDIGVVQAATAAGARAYVGKGSSLPVLLEALEAAGRGRRFVDPSLTVEVASRPLPTSGVGWDHVLSPREREVMLALCAGDRLSSIARRIGVSTKTVGTHKMRLMNKLGVRTLADLVRLAHDHGVGT